MPQIIAAITIQQIIQAFVISAVLGFIAKEFFAPKQQNNSLENEARQRQVLVRSSTEPHRVIVGQALVSGPLAYIENSGNGQEYVNLVILLAAHQCQEIGDVYFDDQLVGDLDGSGNVTTGTFAGLARIKKHLGTDTQAADSDLVAESAGKWTAAHQLCGIAYIYVRLLRDDTAYPNGVPLIRALVKGKLFADPRVSGSPNNPTWSPNWALALYDYYRSDTGLRCLTSEADDLAFIAAANTSDERVIVTYTSPAFTIDGGSPTPNTVTFADDENRLQTGDVVIPGTTGSLAGTGLTAGTPIWFIRINSTEGKFATSYANAIAGTAVALGGAGTGVHTLTPAPKVTAANATEKLTFESPERFISLGDGVQPFSTGTLPTGLSSITYYAIKTRDFEMQLAATYADALAGIPVAFSSDGTGTLTIKHIDQARYTVNGTYTLGETPSNIVSKMLAAGGGVQTYSQGVFSIFAGAYTSPTVTITEDDLRGPITGTTGPDAKDLFNAVRGTYVDQWKYWQPSDFPPVTSATYQAQDGGEQYFSDIDLALVTDVVRAQRLAKITLERARRGESITLPCKLTKFDADVWDTAQVTIAVMGYSGDVFRVTGWRFNWDENGPGVDLTLTREDSAIYTWSSSDATHNAVAPPINVPAPTTVVAPVGLGSPAGLLITVERAVQLPASDGTVTYDIDIAWGAPAEPNLYGYELQWKNSSDGTYNGVILPASQGESYRLRETKAESTYDIRVRTVSKLYARSAWLTGSVTVSNPDLPLVDTPDIKDAAVTSNAQGYTAGTTVVSNNSPRNEEIQRVTIDYTNQGPVLIIASAVVFTGTPTATDITLRVDMALYRIYDLGSPPVTVKQLIGTVPNQLRSWLDSSAGTWFINNPATAILFDTTSLPVGPVTYTLEATGLLPGAGGGPAATNINCYNRALYVQEQKR